MPEDFDMDRVSFERFDATMYWKDDPDIKWAQGWHVIIDGMDEYSVMAVDRDSSYTLRTRHPPEMVFVQKLNSPVPGMGASYADYVFGARQSYMKQVETIIHYHDDESGHDDCPRLPAEEAPAPREVQNIIRECIKCSAAIPRDDDAMRYNTPSVLSSQLIPEDMDDADVDRLLADIGDQISEKMEAEGWDVEVEDAEDGVDITAKSEDDQGGMEGEKRQSAADALKDRLRREMSEREEN